METNLPTPTTARVELLIYQRVSITQYHLVGGIPTPLKNYGVKVS